MQLLLDSLKTFLLNCRTYQTQIESIHTFSTNELRQLLLNQYGYEAPQNMTHTKMAHLAIEEYNKSFAKALDQLEQFIDQNNNIIEKR
jgi:hypothetical protein